KKLRKTVYNINEQTSEKLPLKPNSQDLEETLLYCKELLETIQKDAVLMFHPAVSEKVHYLKEIVEDHGARLKESVDDDARIGHKSRTNAFFGYKTHLAMTEDGIITAAKVTSGEKSDGSYLRALVEKSQNAGVKIENIIGDTAYSIKENLDYVEGLSTPENTEESESPENIKLVSKLMPRVSEGARKKEAQLDYNKDAEMFVCKAGHLAISKIKRHNQQVHRKENPREVYYFDVEKCKRCPLREGCYHGTKTKSYSVSLTSDVQTSQKAFQKTKTFKDLSKRRYKIEAKNSELKNQHGYRRAESSGIQAMEIQGATAIFCVNLLRIVRLMEK
ncbi:MAG: transposase, partial [Eubacterium sp.]